jgi:hypothetical protein
LTDDIDIITAALHGDKQAVLKDQLERIDREIIERLAINITTRTSLHELMREVREDVLLLEPPHLNAPDDPTKRHERLGLKREYRYLVKDLMAEQRSCWNDTQALKTEMRIVEKELLALKQRDRRLTEFL